MLGGEDAEAMGRTLTKIAGGASNGLARNAAARLARAEPGGTLTRLAALFEPAKPYAELLARLSAARNDAIGHGALRPNPAETAGLVSWFVAGAVGDRQPSSPGGKIAARVTVDTGLTAAAVMEPWKGLRLEAEDEDGRST